MKSFALMPFVVIQWHPNIVRRSKFVRWWRDFKTRKQCWTNTRQIGSNHVGGWKLQPVQSCQTFVQKTGQDY